VRPSTLARRHILAALWIPNALDATAVEARRGTHSDRSWRTARAELHREGVIVWSRKGWQGTPTWTLHRDKLRRQEVRNVYAIVTAQAVERGDPPPPLPRNLYHPRSPKWHQAQAMRDLAVFQAEQVRAHVDERIATGEPEAQQKRRLEQLARAQAAEEELASMRASVQRWTGPNIADLPSSPTNSLGVPR
jgi:hypothetical protein